MMPVLQAWKTWRRRRLVGRRLTAQADRQVVVAKAAADLGRHGLRLTKADDRIVLQFDLARVLGDHWLLAMMSSRPAVLVHLLAKTVPAVRSLRAEVSDGEESGPGVVSFCATDTAAILVPDPEFFSSRGHEAVRRHVRSNPSPWRERADLVLWRGSTTGMGHAAGEPMSPANLDLAQRTRLCLALRGLDGVDAKISNVVQTATPERDTARLRDAGVLGTPIDRNAWNSVKFAIDIDGNSNAWSNLFQRLLYGCCVIKVASPSGYRQWYYGGLEPWRHYVPVRADLGDLVERIAWCRANPSACAAIAAAGQAFAQAMTFESEMAAAVAMLNRKLG